MLSIDLSNFCSKACPFCYNHSHRVGQSVWTPAEVVSFATSCVDNGVKAVSLGGGEPFEYEGVFEIINILQKKCYLTVTTNGLPLEDTAVWNRLRDKKPDKIHISIHHPEDNKEVARVLKRLQLLQALGIKPGINLLVDNTKIAFATKVYNEAVNIITPQQIILIPQRFSHTPTAKQLAQVAGGHMFQSPSCLLQYRKPQVFASVSWDKQVNYCSFAKGKAPLPSLDYQGLQTALSQTHFRSCLEK